MDIFGDQWRDHHLKIEEAWQAAVRPEDMVLLPGDLSWAMTLEEARVDLEWIDRLPGKKIILRGNHDYWWSSIKKVRDALPPSMMALQNDFFETEKYIIAGSRGWNLPLEGLSQDIAADEKIFQRERGRLILSLRNAPKGKPLIVMMHYPPFVKGCKETGFSDILEEYGAAICVYGHFHGPDSKRAYVGKHGNVRYYFCAADGVNFAPVLISPEEND